MDRAKKDEQKNNQQEALVYFINLIISCVERGGFKMTDVLNINKTINEFTNKETVDEDKKKCVLAIINYILFIQSKGKLTLQESHLCYIHMQHFNELPATETKTKVV